AGTPHVPPTRPGPLLRVIAGFMPRAVADTRSKARQQKTRRSGFFVWPVQLPVEANPFWPVIHDAGQILCLS
ncbi:hypothetical protein, partial [Pseudomonas sp.]|uniref:hypothetical protein n=1 Tax=Pseudomonas sp. TaxID=306 RepID=UPI002587548D